MNQFGRVLVIVALAAIVPAAGMAPLLVTHDEVSDCADATTHLCGERSDHDSGLCAACRIHAGNPLFIIEVPAGLTPISGAAPAVPVFGADSSPASHPGNARAPPIA